MNLHIEGGGIAPPHIASSVPAEQEFLALLQLRRQVDRRLDDLLDVLDPQPQRATLPLSGLRQSAPGVFLFKGGRHA